MRLLCYVVVSNVSRPGYYGWLNHKPGKRKQQDILIHQEIVKAHAVAPTYGVDNIHTDVRENIICGHQRVRHLMREMKIASQRRGEYEATTNGSRSHPAAPNRLKGVKVTAPNQVWVSDITYIATDEVGSIWPQLKTTSHVRFGDLLLANASPQN